MKVERERRIEMNLCRVVKEASTDRSEELAHGPAESVDYETHVR